MDRCAYAEEYPDWAVDMTVAEQWERAMADLYDLAAIYADHADYRGEWRP